MTGLTLGELIVALWDAEGAHLGDPDEDAVALRVALEVRRVLLELPDEPRQRIVVDVGEWGEA